MRILNKTHRGASIAAAVVMLITLLAGTGLNIVSMIGSARDYEASQLLTAVLNLGINAIASILLIVALLRGKKDTVAGVLFLITLVRTIITGVIGGITGMIGLLAVMSFMTGGMFASLLAARFFVLLANLAGAAFRAMLAIECFKPGKVSGGKMKLFFLLLPIVNILLTVVSQMAQSLYMIGDYGIGEYLVITMLPAVFSAVMSIGMVLLGLAFSIPVYEKMPYEYAYGAQTEYNPN